MMEWRLMNLMGEYQQKTKQRLSYRTIAEDTGLSKTTIASMANGKIQRPDLETLNAVLTYMTNKLGRALTTDDLLHFEEES